MPVYMFDQRTPVHLTDDDVAMARMAIEEAKDDPRLSPMRLLRNCGMDLKTAVSAVKYAQENPA